MEICEFWKSFVAETVANWNTLPSTKSASAILNDKINEIFASSAKQPSRYDTGTKGEDAVRQELRKQGYCSETTPGSRTPADVWTIRHDNENKIAHIGLIQVKTTISDSPQTLSQSDIDDLERLAKFVWHEIKQTTPFKNDDEKIIISWGYAGIVLANKTTPMLKSATYFDAFYDKVINRDAVNGYCERFHKVVAQ